jgi:hypothetical protein
MPTVVVCRPRDDYHDWLAGSLAYLVYRVRIGDHIAGEVEHGRAASFHVPAGQHTVRVEKDLALPNKTTVIVRQRSNTVTVNLPEPDTVALSCLRPGLLRAAMTTGFLRGRRYFDLHLATTDEAATLWRHRERGSETIVRRGQ